MVYIMKTREEISKWLKDKPWYEKFKKNIIENEFSILNGCEGGNTIVGAFTWCYSDEGYRFWQDINNEFIEWLYGDSSMNGMYVNNEYKTMED